LHKTKVHMFGRCPHFSCDDFNMFAMVMDTLVADGVIERSMIKGVAHYRVSETGKAIIAE